MPKITDRQRQIYIKAGEHLDAIQILAQQCGNPATIIKHATALIHNQPADVPPEAQHFHHVAYETAIMVTSHAQAILATRGAELHRLAFGNIYKAAHRCNQIVCNYFWKEGTKDLTR